MAKGLNKHTPNSDELLKRLESNDSSGLDDFEKEALEGFDSLENIPLAKNLTDSLNKKIDEKYLNKESGGKKGMMYLSLAAGLVLVVGLSIFFMNIMGDKKEMAMESAPTTEQIINKLDNPTDLTPSEEVTKNEGKGGDVNTITTTDALAEKAATGGGKDIPDDTRKKTEADKDDGLTSRMVVKETKPGQSVADNEGEKDFKQQPETKTTSGPPAGNNAPVSPSVVMLEDQKSLDKEEERNEKVSLSKNNSDANQQASSGKESGVKKRAAPKKEKSKSGEALGSDDIAANDESSVSQTAVGGVAAEPKRDESGYLHNVEYGNHAYYKPQDYLKVEINKSEMLKTNVKAFKAELTINEKGTVTAVKFLTGFTSNCPNCKKELEKILLNMPGWKPKSKSAVETVSYIDQ